MAVTPHIAALLFGRYVLKMNPVILLRRLRRRRARSRPRCARSRTKRESKLPVLGYTVPYAIGNILLTAWGPVIVMLTK